MERPLSGPGSYSSLQRQQLRADSRFYLPSLNAPTARIVQLEFANGEGYDALVPLFLLAWSFDEFTDLLPPLSRWFSISPFCRFLNISCFLLLGRITDSYGLWVFFFFATYRIQWQSTDARLNEPPSVVSDNTRATVISLVSGNHFAFTPLVLLAKPPYNPHT